MTCKEKDKPCEYDYETDILQEYILMFVHTLDKLGQFLMILLVKTAREMQQETHVFSYCSRREGKKVKRLKSASLEGVQ